VRPLFKAPREDGSWFRAELDCSQCSSTIQPQQKNENKKYDNSTFKKIKRPVAFAAGFASHPARARLLWAFTDGASG
jgi:hypothetical protein